MDFTSYHIVQELKEIYRTNHVKLACDSIIQTSIYRYMAIGHAYEWPKQTTPTDRFIFFLLYIIYIFRLKARRIYIGLLLNKNVFQLKNLSTSVRFITVTKQILFQINQKIYFDLNTFSILGQIFLKKKRIYIYTTKCGVLCRKSEFE